MNTAQRALKATHIYALVVLSVVTFFISGSQTALAAVSFEANDIDGDTGWSQGAIMGDVNGDGFLDIYVVNSNGQNKLWINDGDGGFTTSDIPSDTGSSYDAAIGDIEGDGDLDIYVANHEEQNKLWINDGEGNFTAKDIVGDTGGAFGAAMGDVNGDGDLDIYVTVNGLYGQNKLWINNGDNTFTDTEIDGDTGDSRGAVIRDVNGDGNRDIYVANFSGQQNKLWINNGDGTFTASDIDSDTGSSFNAVMGDVNGDGDLDIYVANYEQQNKLWINNGDDTFTATDITDDIGWSYDAAMGDVDDDGDLDIYVANEGQQNKLWINNGEEGFSASDIDGDIGYSTSVVMGDVDGNDFLDIYVSDYDGQNKLWINATDVTAPTINSFSPADNAADVAVDTNFTLTFDEAVEEGSGFISLKKASDNTTVEAFDVSSEISGGGSTTITFDPAEDLVNGIQYYIEINATAFDDAAGNNYAGISDTTTWNFTTEPNPEPTQQPSRSSSGGGIIYGCKDKDASNYEYFSRHKQELCEYDNPEQTLVDIVSEHRDLLMQAYYSGIALPQNILDLLGINTPKVRDLEYGMEGDDVRALQTLLINEGYSIPAGATGLFVNQTEAALAEYQAVNGINPAVGYFGPITRAQMKAAEFEGLWW